MKAFKFNLSGKTAFFKKPDINQKTSFTYSHISKTFILGLLGAIIGLDKDKYYDELKHLKIAIIPNKPYFNKSVQVYNNVSKFANKSTNNPVTLNIREQWLEDVNWDIYILSKDDDDIYNKINRYIKEFKSVYNIYLGRKEHIANVKFIEDIEVEEIKKEENQIKSLFPYKIIEDIDDNKPENCKNEESFFLKESFPISYNDIGLYNYEVLVYTNHEIFAINDRNNLYKIGDKVCYFI